MTWTSPTTRITGELITAAIWNSDIVDNFAYLLERPMGVLTVDRGSNFQTTSGSWAAIHATDLAITLEMQTTRARVSFIGLFQIETSAPGQGRIYLDVAVDNVRQAGDDGISILAATTSGFREMLLDWIVEGLSPGAHTFTIQWRVTASAGSPTGTLYAGAGTSGYDTHPQLSVVQL